MEIKSVAVLGAGAVGSYVIWGLSGVKNIELGVVAEGERAKRLKEKGCTINHTVYHPHVWTPQEAYGVDSAGCFFEIRSFAGSTGEYTGKLWVRIPL